MDRPAALRERRRADVSPRRSRSGTLCDLLAAFIPRTGVIERATIRHVRRVSLCLAAATLAGCGGAASQRPAAVVSERQWRSNATIIVRQLQNDIAATQLSGETTGTARAALHDDSVLYGLLVSYSDFGGCRSMVAAAGEAGRSQIVVERLLAASCKRLERASALFTEAVTRNDGAGLLAAANESRRALPLLVRAAAALTRSKGQGS